MSSNAAVAHPAVTPAVEKPSINSLLSGAASHTRKWLHEHPIIQKSAVVGLAAIGFQNLVEGVTTFSVYQTAKGAVMLGGAYAAHKLLPIFIPPTHKPSDKVFQEGSHKGVSLKYHGNLPVLTIPEGVTPYDAGYARGYLMASQIRDLHAKNDFAFFTLRGLPRKIEYLVQLAKKVIPESYLMELHGIVAGYKDKRDTWKYLKGLELTIDDLVYFHLLPDVAHVEFKQGNDWAKRHILGSLGCSVVVDGDGKTGPRAMRTVDWIPMDVYGKYSFVEFRATAGGMRTVGQSFPLFAGALTVMNQHGLCAAMNVTRGLTDYPDKLPAVFYLRQMIESCESVRGERGVMAFIDKNIQSGPLGPFNLSVLDKQEAASVHFYQGEKLAHYARVWKPGQELVTLNYRYGEKGETNPTFTNSPQRKAEIEAYYAKLHREGKFDATDSSERLKALAKGKEVNNVRTMTVAYFDPQQGIFEICFDNGYAANRPLMKIPVQEWFRK